MTDFGPTAARRVPDGKLTPERAVRVLHAKAAELEAIVLDDDIRGGRGSTDLCADIALIARLLADHIERMEPVHRYAIAHGEHGVRGDPESMPPLVEARRDLLATNANITREMLESRRPYVTKTGKVLTDAEIEEWADEAERGYDITHKPPSLGMTDDRQPQQQGETP